MRCNGWLFFPFLICFKFFWCTRPSTQKGICCIAVKNTSGNIIKHNLWTSMNERTLFFIKIYISHTLFSKGLIFLWCRRHGRRELYSKREGFFFPYLLPGARGWQRLDPPCKLVRDASDQLRVPCSTPKSDRVVLITWSPSGYTPVRPECPDAPSSSCLLIKMWQLTKAHGVTWNEPKIHVICYITHWYELIEF